MCGGGCGKEGVKRCTGCYLVHYCGTDCQRTAWSSHSTQCKQSRAQYKTVTLVTKQDEISFNYKSRNVSIGDIKKEKPSKNHCVVKVQVPLNTKLIKELFVYNEDRSVCGYLHRDKGQEDTYDKLRHEIENSGFNGQKAFYYGIYKTGEIMGKNRVEVVEINVEVMLSVEKW